MKKENQRKLNCFDMKKVVLVTEPHYGICWLDVERVLALVPEKNMLVFESIC